MIHQSVWTGGPFSTSSIQRGVIPPQGHNGSNQNCTFSADCALFRHDRGLTPLHSGIPVCMVNFDIVLRGGRVIDRVSGLDEVRDVAIAGNRVAQVGTALPPGRREQDVAGHVVAASFIDLPSHAFPILGAPSCRRWTA